MFQVNKSQPHCENCWQEDIWDRNKKHHPLLEANHIQYDRRRYDMGDGWFECCLVLLCPMCNEFYYYDEILYHESILTYPNANARRGGTWHASRIYRVKFGIVNPF